MNNTFTRLIALGAVVTTICGTSLVIRDYNSQYSVIKQGIAKLQEVGQHWKDQYSNLLNDLDDVEGTLAQVKLKLESIYETITGKEYDEATLGDIMNFDFSTVIKDQSYNNNLDAEAICGILGIPTDSTDEVIIAKIQELVDQVKSLEQQILEYQAEEATLVGQLNQFKEDLDKALKEANDKIDTANQEDLAVIDDLNNSLQQLGSDYRVTANGGVEDEDEPEEDEPVVDNSALEAQLAEAKTAFETVLVGTAFEAHKTELLNGTQIIEPNGSMYRVMQGSTQQANYPASEKSTTAYNAWVTYYELYQQLNS